MKKYLLVGIAGGIIFASSCKKDNSNLEEQSVISVSADALSEKKVSALLAAESTAVNGYMFKAARGTDVTSALQSALNKNKIVYIDDQYIISNSLIIQSNGALLGTGNAVLKAANARYGLLNTRGTYIDLRNRRHSTVAGLTFKPADNMFNMAGYGNTVILLSNASNCRIEKNNFDFSFKYSQGMDAVWITTGSNSNVVSENYIKTLGITYCENGSSFNRVEKNRIINSSGNALGGIGNGTKICYNNQVLNNYIENAGRMGLEDQQQTNGTVVRGNIINGSGKNPSLADGEGMGISTVAVNSLVEDNKVKDAKSYYIEVRGSSYMRVLNNEINDKGQERGIFVNFVNKSSSASLNTIVRGNKITGCYKGIETFGDGTSQLVTITNNSIIDPAYQGISIDFRRSVQSSITIKQNSIVYNTKSNTSRHGITTYTAVPSGSQNYYTLIENNSITYNPSSIGGKGYDMSLMIQVDKAIVNYNTINGYSGGYNYGVSNNGSKTAKVRFLGNTVRNAIWNLELFKG